MPAPPIEVAACPMPRLNELTVPKSVLSAFFAEISIELALVPVFSLNTTFR